MSKEELIYAGFWGRFVALTVDVIIFVPFVFLDLWLDGLSRTYAIASLFPVFVVGTAYSVYFHARYGQTLGKMAAGIKVVALDGSPITLRQAFLRSSVDIILGLLSLCVYASGLLYISADDYAIRSVRYEQLNNFRKPWRWLDWLYDVWFWSEIVVILFNKKRRALHDFIAGTVVIRVEKVEEPQEIHPALP